MHISFLKKKNVEWNCDKGITEIRGKKNCHNWFVAMSLPKMGGKKIVVAEIWGGIKKKECYVYNIFTTNHMWLVIISSNLNLTLRLLF